MHDFQSLEHVQQAKFDYSVQLDIKSKWQTYTSYVCFIIDEKNFVYNEQMFYLRC